MKLQESNHPYYCSESNYHSNECNFRYKTFKEFLSNWWTNLDVDMNLIFRWDIYKDEEDGHFSLNLFMIQQRKGKFCPIEIENIEKKDMVAFEKFITPHKEKIIELRKPLM